MPSEDGLITLREIEGARKNLAESDLGVIKTPLLKHVTGMFPQLPKSVDLYLKLENTQTTGSFKIRGVANQMKFLPDDVKNGERKLITMSAGNYGKAFAYALQKHKLSGLCLMPITAPQSRVELIKNLGCVVETYLHSEIRHTMKRYEQTHGYHVLHSFDDKDLIAGYASASLEILEEDVKPDIVLVCCGGGGLVSGVASGFKLSGLKDCRIYAVEPQGSPTMYESYKKGSPVTMRVKSIAGGLSPPFAGTRTFQHCKKYVKDVILVSDQELLDTMQQFYKRGLVVEPSGCAAMAALLGGHVPDIEGKKIVVFVTGGNVSPSEMVSLLQ
ncbi:L-threonine ammonia-lyase-like isoform X1 [Mytilus galloprovincialis]|uniref:L-threonine ammonia-lyase-like isoform X1 n=1 Tax=Mytilus galloprovincialis TaxID=29158 RepID=UPI003F7C31EF